jgi:hypothetical protein
MVNGTVYGITGNSRDVPATEGWGMRAIRYTLVAKSRTKTRDNLSQTLPAYADQCPSGCTYSDGYVRRLVQGTVQLRNFGL